MILDAPLRMCFKIKLGPLVWHEQINSIPPSEGENILAPLFDGKKY